MTQKTMITKRILRNPLLIRKHPVTPEWSAGMTNKIILRQMKAHR